MPSKGRQKAKARKSKEMDMMLDFENMNVILGIDNVNPIEPEISNVFGNSKAIVTMSLIHTLGRMISGKTALDTMSVKT